MTRNDRENPMDALEQVIELERLALLRGDLDSMQGLLGRKEALIERMNSLAPRDRADISMLREKAKRNQELLDGALEGIRNVSSRMAAMRQIRRNLATYDSSGRKSEIGSGAGHQLEKRA